MSAQEPLLPSHTDTEKKDLELAPPIILNDDEDVELRVGREGYKARAVKKWRGLTRMQKVLVGVLAVWVVISLVGKVADELDLDDMFEKGWKGKHAKHGKHAHHGNHGKHGHHGGKHGHGGEHAHDAPAIQDVVPIEYDMDAETWMPSDADFVPQQVQEVVTAEFPASDVTSLGNGFLVFNSTFSLPAISQHLAWVAERHSGNDQAHKKDKKHDKHRGHHPHGFHGGMHDWSKPAFAVDLAAGVAAEIIVSTEDVATASVVVESAWDGVEGVQVIQLTIGERLDALALPAIEGASYKVHLVLPTTAHRVPPLKIRSPAAVPITFHASAAHLTFSHLTIASDADVAVPQVDALSARIFTTSGEIKGHYNVSRSLVLRTVTGDIEAVVVASPYHRGAPPPPGDKGEHFPWPPPSGPPRGPSNGGEPELEARKHGRTKRMVSPGPMPCSSKPSFLARLFGFKKPHHPPPPHHPPHPPIFIGAFSTTGSITLDIYSDHFPAPFLKTVTKAYSHTGDVFVHVSRFFKGFFEAEVAVGELDVATGGNKTLEVLHQVTTEKGEKLVGLIHPANGTWPHPPKGPHGPHGPHGPGGPKPPKGPKKPKKGKRAEDDDDEEIEAESPEFDFEKGPGGPPPPPPHKGPGGPHPPPPPHGPHGPHPPTPPGFSKVFARTDVGKVKLRI